MKTKDGAEHSVRAVLNVASLESAHGVSWEGLTPSEEGDSYSVGVGEGRNPIPTCIASVIVHIISL